MSRLCTLLGLAAGAMIPIGPAFAQSTKFVDVGRGDVPVYLPAGYDDQTPIPLIVMLHGYSASGAIQESYFRFRAQQDDYSFILTTPDGTTDAFGNRFWNATQACCDFFQTGVDDSGYIRALIDAVADQCAVDPNRIYLLGHSNGGFMSFRMACEHADRVAAIASLAGATFDDPADCLPSEPVHILQIHGTNDGTIFYNGGSINGNAYPGALETTEQWAVKNGCASDPESFPPLDLDQSIAGEETIRTVFQACDSGGAAELWTIVGGGHVPVLSDSFAPAVIEWFLDHPKTCDADYDGNGVVDSRDVVAFLNAWTSSDPGADCDGSGALDTRDLTCFLNRWAAGC